MIFQSPRKSDECKCTYRAGATCSTGIGLIKIPKLTSVVALVKGPKTAIGLHGYFRKNSRKNSRTTL